MSDAAEGKSMLAMTVQLAMRIAIVWAAGFLLAVGVSAMLPDKSGFHFAGKHGALFLSYSRAGFWTCVLAALTVTGLIVFRAIAADIGSSPLP